MKILRSQYKVVARLFIDPLVGGKYATLGASFSVIDVESGAFLGKGSDLPKSHGALNCIQLTAQTDNIGRLAKPYGFGVTLDVSRVSSPADLHELSRYLKGFEKKMEGAPFSSFAAYLHFAFSKVGVDEVVFESYSEEVQHTHRMRPMQHQTVEDIACLIDGAMMLICRYKDWPFEAILDGYMEDSDNCRLYVKNQKGQSLVLVNINTRPDPVWSLHTHTKCGEPEYPLAGASWRLASIPQGSSLLSVGSAS